MKKGYLTVGHMQHSTDKTSPYHQGMIQGEIAFKQVHQGHVLTAEQIYDLLMKMLLNPTHPSLWNVGCVMGWTKAYHERPPFLHPLSEALLIEQTRQQEVARLLKHIEAGELTLREAANTVDGLLFIVSEHPA